MPNPSRTALLIRCSVEEAAKIRSAARAERRTLSGYVMQAVMNRLSVDDRLRDMQKTTAARRARY
jgi:uncharacterized protein (DUF1778 family)